MTRGTAVLAVLALTACGGGIDIKSDYDPAAVQAMNSYKTYSWATAKRDQTISTLNAQRIHDAIDNALKTKGFTKVESGGDFQVAFIATTAQQTDYTTTNDYYGYGWGRWYGAGGGMSTSRTTAYNWQQGTLVLDIVDAKTNQMVYRSTAQAEVDQDLSPTERQTRLNTGALKMLEKFPPK